jgi:hypothetical protein
MDDPHPATPHTYRKKDAGIPGVQTVALHSE